MNAEGYLAQTKDAVQQLISAAVRYEEILAGEIPPSQAKEQSQVERYMAAAEEYFGLQFSQATLCGSILQVAFMGIDLFSENTVIPPDCSNLVRPIDTKAIKFCIGRPVHSIPIGLLVYAGRNQYNHWDDKTFDFPTTEVFEALIDAYRENSFFDMAYELNYPERTIKSNYIVLGELGWGDYDSFYRDMIGLVTK